MAASRGYAYTGRGQEMQENIEQGMAREVLVHFYNESGRENEKIAEIRCAEHMTLGAAVVFEFWQRFGHDSRPLLGCCDVLPSYIYIVCVDIPFIGCVRGRTGGRSRTDFFVFYFVLSPRPSSCGTCLALLKLITSFPLPTVKSQGTFPERIEPTS